MATPGSARSSGGVRSHKRHADRRDEIRRTVDSSRWRRAESRRSLESPGKEPSPAPPSVAPAGRSHLALASNGRLAQRGWREQVLSSSECLAAGSTAPQSLRSVRASPVGNVSLRWQLVRIAITAAIRRKLCLIRDYPPNAPVQPPQRAKRTADGCNRKLDEASSPAATDGAETTEHLFGLQQMLPL